MPGLSYRTGIGLGRAGYSLAISESLGTPLSNVIGGLSASNAGMGWGLLNWFSSVKVFKLDVNLNPALMDSTTFDMSAAIATAFPSGTANIGPGYFPLTTLTKPWLQVNGYSLPFAISFSNTVGLSSYICGIPILPEVLLNTDDSNYYIGGPGVAFNAFADDGSGMGTGVAYDMTNNSGVAGATFNWCGVSTPIYGNGAPGDTPGGTVTLTAMTYW